MDFPERLQALAEASAPGKLPPVEKWNPPLSGDMDLVITADGKWIHESRPITRAELVKLFASILKKEGEDYYLVSPVEKWRIQVEDAPLYVVEMGVEQVENPRIYFRTATDDFFCLDQTHSLRMAEGKPYVHVHRGLEALVSRNVFYRLAELAIHHEGRSGVWSSGTFFPLE